MKISMNLRTAAIALGFFAANWAFAAVENPQSVMDLLDRVGGPGTSSRIVTIVDDTFKSADGSEKFRISSRDGKPCITGTTLSAVTTGVGWYLNHTANVNPAWNNPHPDLTSLPLPSGVEEHTTAATYRYYLNYCTFSYSMSTWTWERWQEEIDWMALHGINMPLQIVGLEEVWRKFLMEDYGYSRDEANAFVGGPCFMAWFGMNNLQGWGGPNPDWWYERQAALGKKINERMKALGIEPVLPGFAGMVPDNFTAKTGIAATSQGGWCGYTRPYIVDSTGENFGEVASKYYARLKEVMGESAYYSLDPYHEGGAAPSDPGQGYRKMYEAMTTARPDSKWVIQSWQWSGAQRQCLANVPKGRLIVLDLYSDGQPGWNNYDGHDTVYSTIFNFGGRTGFFGRFNGIIDGYFNARQTASVKGIGAAPEAIEQTPVMYDLLFELPWMDSKPDAAEWMAGYARRRYSAESTEAAEAWELLRKSALDCRTGLQGPHEAVMCARPDLTVDRVSSWGGSNIFYDQNMTATAAYKMLAAGLSGNNYSYDLTDLTRQAITDYSKSLLAGIKEAHSAGNAELFAARRDAFLGLMLDIDELLNTHPDFMLGHWTERARNMADEVSGTGDSDRNWLEHDNARTLITTWGPEGSANGGGLRDYSYRQWGGMVKDYYYARWKQWFDNGMNAPAGGWFRWEWNWAHNNPKRYETTPTGETAEVAARLLGKYLSAFEPNISGAEARYIPRMLVTDLRGKLYDRAKRGESYCPPLAVAGTSIVEIAVDLNRSTLFEDDEKSSGSTFAIAADAPIGERSVKVTLADGTELYYTLKIIEEITADRTVSVATEDASHGSVSIDGTDALSVTGKEFYVLRATPTDSYDFDHWTDATGADAGNDNPMTYYGKENASFTAHFVENRWGVPETDFADGGDIQAYRQWVSELKLKQHGEESVLYSTAGMPEKQFVTVPTRIKAAPGAEFSIDWNGGDGLQYLFLTAYADYNGDGVFDINSDELIATVGTHGSTNAAVKSGSLRFLLPYDMPKGTTHIRLRFDGAWFGEYDSATGAVAPDAKIMRYVYELMLEVTDGADYTSKVTYAINDRRLGSMRSENETGLYLPGEDVIITVFPAEGARIARWVDGHGRELPAAWCSENSVRFRAFDDAHIIAELEPADLEVDGWAFGWQYSENGGVRLTRIVKAAESGELDLSKIKNLEAIDPEVFRNCPELHSVIMPDVMLTETGAEIFSTSIKGDGTENKITDLPATIGSTESWRMVMEGTYSGKSFNNYGSGLYGNGTNCLASDFSNGWSQFYLAKNGILKVKWDSGSETSFDNVNLTGSFRIVADYDAEARRLTVTASNGNGDIQTKTISNTSVMQPISRFATAVAAGTDYTLGFYRPASPQLPGNLFRGCSQLVKIDAWATNPYYKSVNGVLYDKAGSDVTAFPEGLLFKTPMAIGGAGKNAVAMPVKGASGFSSLGVALTDSEAPASAWHLEGKAGKVALVHYNSGLKLAKTGSALSTTDAGAAAVDYSVAYGAGFPDIKVTSEGKCLQVRSGSLAFAAGDAVLEFDSPVDFAVTAPASMFTLALPATASLPRDVKCYFVNSVSPDGVKVVECGTQEQHYLPAMTGIIVGGTATGAEVTATVPAVGVDGSDCVSGTNLLRATTTDLELTDDYYALDGDGKFHLCHGGTIGANSAYLLKSDLPAGISAETLDIIDVTMGIDEIGADKTDNAPLFDLSGRRASDKPAPGVYIDARGNKSLIR